MQSINFTMLAPSGAGGAYFTELLDDNWSVEGTQNKDNNRCSKTNEYAGSSNSFRIDDYKLHVKFNDFPDWNENTILLGLIPASNASLSSPLETTSAPEPILPSIFIISLLKFAFTA